MKRCWALLLAAGLLLGGCAPQAEAVSTPEPVSAEEHLEDAAPPAPQPEEEEETVQVSEPTVYQRPGEDMTVEEVILAYFEQQYLSYLTFTDIDLTAIIEPTYSSIRNSIRWTSKLNQRRRLLYESGLCYVETEEFPHTIRWIEAEDLRDERLSMWDVADLTGMGEVLVHFEIEGEAGRAYPPQMPVNTQHTMRLYQFDGQWKIIFHYFPGSIRKYLHADGLAPVSDQQMMAELEREFSLSGLPGEAPEYPDSALRYDEEAAARYALAYTESYNETFYRVSPWLGDCANFISQCVWSGFGGRDDNPSAHMTEDWFAGEGGGSPPWENVEYFWSYMTENAALRGHVLRGIGEAWTGDLIQTSAPGFEDEVDTETGGDGDGPYHHCLLVVDPDRLMLAQHSPDTFVYYADLVNVETRLVRPAALIVP